MAELRIGTLLPTAGDLKVGSLNVLKIYNGGVLVFGDGTFNENLGTGPRNTVKSISIQSDGKIIFAGISLFSFNGNSIGSPARLNTDGTLDSAYMANRAGQGDNANLANTTTLHPDGSVLIGGRRDTTRAFSKINDDGTADTTFNTNAGSFNNSTDNVYAIDVSGTIILIVGSFGDGNIKKYDLNGNEDTNFGSGISGFGTSSTIRTIKTQSDGKILVGGDFSTFNFTSINRLVRLNSDGSIDTSFTTNQGDGILNGGVYSIAIQSDGKILVGGSFTFVDGSDKERLFRLNSDGTYDNDFYDNLGDGFNNPVYSVEVQSDGKILVGGTFNQFDGNIRNRLVRLNSDGTEDTSFYTNLTNGVPGEVWITETQTDDKILVGGNFASIGSVNLNNFARVNSNGTVEP